MNYPMPCMPLNTLWQRWPTGLRIGVLGVFIAILLGWNVYQFWQLRPGGKAPPQSPNAVTCIRCGWCGWKPTLHLPLRCPQCHQLSVHFAGICPHCHRWTPWNKQREQSLYACPRLFLTKGPAHFFPRCRWCGTPTNANGRQAWPASSVSRLSKPAGRRSAGHEVSFDDAKQ